MMINPYRKMASMPVATSSPIKRSAGEGEEKKEGSSREASPASKRQKLDAGGSSSGNGGKQARTVSPTKPDGAKVKAGLPKLDVAAAASRASDAAAGGFFFQSNIQSDFFPPKGKVVKELRGELQFHIQYFKAYFDTLISTNF